jgi:hypothetical protein
MLIATKPRSGSGMQPQQQQLVQKHSWGIGSLQLWTKLLMQVLQNVRTQDWVYKGDTY